MEHNSILFDIDYYKSSHYLQFQQGMTSLFSYIEAREGGEYSETVFFGLQYYLRKYLSSPITVAEVNEAKQYYQEVGVPFNYDGWMYIAKELNGKLPVRIRGAKEGAVIPVSNILVSVESTDTKVPWITSWLETSLLRNIWYGTNVATRSYTIKQMLKAAMEKSSDTPNNLQYMLNDFGSRGVSSQESAGLGGAAHLTQFSGTDNSMGVLYARRYYDHQVEMASIPASEHSSITSWGKENEVSAYRNMLTQFGKPGAMFACVSDSYDLYNALSNLWGGELKEEIIKSGAVVILRPDSGEPVEVVSKSLQLLDEKFGHTINSKGFKVLNNVRVIQGDGITEKSIQAILNKIIEDGFSVENLALGCGGYLLQFHNRDTNRWAMKASSITVNGEERDVFKDPITDKGKRSKKGRLDLILDTETQKYQTIRLEKNMITHPFSEMKIVYENGKTFVSETMETIRTLSNGGSK